MFESLQFKVTSLYIELTSSCNLHCLHCYNASGGKQIMSLPLGLAEGAIQQAIECGASFISLSGGEPLLYDSIWDLMDFLEENKIFFLLITNGTLLGKENIKRLEGYHCNIQLSLDGPDSRTHDAVRGKGSFELAINNAKRLRESRFGGDIVIKGVLTSNLTERSIEQYKSIAQDIGAIKVEFGWLNRSGRGKENYGDLFVGNDSIELFLDILHRHKYKDDGIEISDIGYTDKCPLASIEGDVLEISPKITYNGDAFPCQMFMDEEFALGNLYKQSLYDCVRGERFLKILELLSLRREFMRECQHCICKVHCSRGCPALGVNQGGLFSCDEFCKVRKDDFVNTLLGKVRN